MVKYDGEVFLIHANYASPNGVEIERIGQSEVFASYTRFYIVELSTNEDLLDYWVHNKELKVVTKL